MSSSAITIFDRKAVRAHQQRAAAHFADYNLLFKVATERLVERLGEVRRHFPLGVELGSRHGLMAGMLDGKGYVQSLVQCNGVGEMLHPMRGPKLVMDEEALPFAERSVDLVISALGLHWVNDLPGTLIQIRRALKPGGLFLAMLFGPATLQEMREAWAEVAGREGQMSPRISPFLDVKDGGDLLARAGFILPVADSETLTIAYDSPLHVMRDLKGMGETNALHARTKHFTRRSTLFAVVEKYRQLFKEADGSLPASFELVTLTGWVAE